MTVRVRNERNESNEITPWPCSRFFRFFRSAVTPHPSASARRSRWFV